MLTTRRVLTRKVSNFKHAFPDIFNPSEDSSEISSKDSPQKAIPMATIIEPVNSVHSLGIKSPAPIKIHEINRLDNWEEAANYDTEVHDEEVYDGDVGEKADYQQNLARLKGGGSEGGASKIARKEVPRSSDVNIGGRMGLPGVKIKKRMNFTTGGHVYIKFTYESVRDPTIKLDMISDRLRNDKAGLQATRVMMVEQIKKLCQLLRNDKEKEPSDFAYIDEFEKHMEESSEMW
jgi:hypothetical protein